MSYENSNDAVPFPQYSLPSPLGDIFNNYSGLGQENYFSENSVEFTTNAFENGAPAPLETPSYISQAVDDYSLHHIFSTGSQYCANLKKENYIRLEEGNPSPNELHPIPPMLVEQGNPSPNELHGGCYVGGNAGAHNKSSSMYPEISRYVGNLEAFLRGSPRPQQIEGGCRGIEKSVWTRIMERSKLHGDSSSGIFVPKNYNDELNEVSKDEYWISLQSKKSNKDISNLGVSSLPMSNSEYNKSILWSAQVCRDAQASNTPSIDSNGTQNWMQTSDTTGGFYSDGTQEGGENHTFRIYENNNFTEQSPQLYQAGCQNSALATNPSFNLGINGNGMENGNGNGNGVLEKGSGDQGSFVILDSEEDYSAIWEDLNPSPPIFDDGDCYIFPDSQNKDYHETQNNSRTNQVIDTGCGQKVGENSSDNFVKGLIIGEGNPNPDPQSTVKEYAYSTMGRSVEGLDLLTQDQNEVSLGSEWTDDFLLATGILRDDN